MRRARAMKDDARPQPRHGLTHGRGVQHIDGLPPDARVTRELRRQSGTPPGCRTIVVGTPPRDQVAPVAQQAIEQVAAGEARGAGNEDGRLHARQRGTPLSAPLKGEKLPRPASVNDKKNRWSAGMGTVDPG